MDPAKDTTATDAAAAAGAAEAPEKSGEMQGHEVAKAKANQILQQIDQRFKKTMDEMGTVENKLDGVDARLDKMEEQMKEIMQFLKQNQGANE